MNRLLHLPRNFIGAGGTGGDTLSQGLTVGVELFEGSDSAQQLGNRVFIDVLVLFTGHAPQTSLQAVNFFNNVSERLILGVIKTLKFLDQLIELRFLQFDI